MNAAPVLASSKRRGRLAELDALRGLGALAVMLFHYSTRFHEVFPKAPHVPFSFFGGNYRVLLFFAISGFAIFFTLDRLKSAADFVVNRGSRLFPAYWTAMTLTLIAEYAGHVTQLQVPPFAILANVTMLEGFVFLPSVDGAYWTLTVEIAFYVCMMALWASGRVHRVEPVILAWLALKLVFAFAWTDMPERMVTLLVLRFMPFFVIGMLSYRVWSGERRWRDQASYFAATVGTVALTATSDMLLAAVVLIGIFALMIEGGLRFLCVRPLIWLGGISYSLYLVHQNIGFVIMLGLGGRHVSPWIGFAAAVATAITLGYLINRFVERPAQQRIERWWKARRHASALRATPAQA